MIKRLGIVCKYETLCDKCSVCAGQVESLSSKLWRFVPVAMIREHCKTHHCKELANPGNTGVIGVLPVFGILHSVSLTGGAVKLDDLYLFVECRAV